MKTLIAGMGEVGSALHSVLSPVYPTECFDISEPKEVPQAEILHICFPWQEYFHVEVRNLEHASEALHTVIHSTVPQGTSAACGASHSPVIGIHPFLEHSIRTFTKFIGGPDASKVADYFRRAGLKVYLFDSQETTELMKILDTTFYGLCVEFTKEVKSQCEKWNVPFEAWTLWTQNYNAGYAALGFPEYQRPNLVPIMKMIGGHCVLPNCGLLESDFTKFLQERNRLPV